MRRDWQWICGPFTDLGLISFGWLPLYAGFLYYWLAAGDHFMCSVIDRDLCPHWVELSILVTGIITNVHRHYAFALVYGDDEQLAARRQLYVWAPVVLALAVLPSTLYLIAPRQTILRGALYTVFTIVSVISGTWNVYHVIMQKYGFLRIYASKLGYGDPEVEKRMLFSWLLTAIVLCSYVYQNDAFFVLDSKGFLWIWDYRDHYRYLVYALSAPILAYTAYITARWLKIEARHFSAAAVPKLAFVASIALMLVVLKQSLIMGVVLFGFSHALEYCLFANRYTLHRYAGRPTRRLLKAWTRWPIVSNVVLAAAMIALYKGLALRPDLSLVMTYSLFSSMLHFLYDGYLWKMRDPGVRQAILALSA